MKQLLVDFLSPVESKIHIIEGKSSNGKLILRGKLQEAEALNGNNRRYPRETLEREIQRYIKGPMAINNALGELDHPESTVINLKNASHNIKKIWWEGNSVMGELELLPTPSGKIAEALVLSGIPLGISSRAQGSVKQIGEEIEVQDDLDLLCWDLVSIPSTDGAYMTLSEGLTKTQIKEINKYSTVNSLVTEIICTVAGYCSCELKN